MRRVIGCMTGTSIDALDVSLVEIEGHGLNMHPRVVRSLTRPLTDLAPRLRNLAEQKPATATDITRLAHDFALLHAAAIKDLLASEKCDLICVHGQTVFHAPPLSWQLMNPAPIAAAIGCPVVYDLRQADLAAGGQGAPITPIADWVLFRRMHDPMSIINLGGFANFSEWYTDLDPEEEYPGIRGKLATFDIRGGDICACNQILDGLARARLNKPYDEDGRAAQAGVQDDEAFQSLRKLLHSQNAQRRSLGTGDELTAWMERFKPLSTPAILRSACEAIADVIADRLHLKGFPATVAGGGVRNQALLGALSARSRYPIMVSDHHGVPAAYREAICFAVLGALCQDRIPITIPAVTGVKAAPISGAWILP